MNSWPRVLTRDLRALAAFRVALGLVLAAKLINVGYAFLEESLGCKRPSIIIEQST